MKNPTDRVISALASLEHNHDFQTVLEWFKESLSEHDKNNRRAIGEGLTRGQGMAIQLEEIIKTAESARENIKRRQTRGVPF